MPKGLKNREHSSAYASSAEGILEKAQKDLDARRLRQLSALKIYHEREIRKIDSELEILLKDDVVGVIY